jgi:hypothetical protein
MQAQDRMELPQELGAIGSLPHGQPPEEQTLYGLPTQVRKTPV